jgi:LCP family protein required for cell wall assembly
MSDDERDEDETPEPPEGDAGSLPEEEEKSLGLTEEFARLEEEIQREVGRTPEAEEGSDAEESVEDESPEDEAPVDFGDTDSSEWVVPAAAAGGETEEWLSADDELSGEEPSAEGVGEAEDAEEEPEAEPEAEEPGSEEAPVADEPPIEHTIIRHGPPPVPIAATGYGEDEEDPEVKSPGLWWRFLTASVLIVVSVATAVSVSSLLLLTDVAAKLQPIPGLADKLEQINPGDPQTILIVGSDKRSNIEGDPGRSDTTMLLRVDPDNQVLSLFSLPRDLKVDIAGQNYGTGKLNEAFAAGGVKKTLATVQNLTGLKINHVVNVDFQGFADAVDAIGCVYVDVDRHYFNDNSQALSSLDSYAEINVNAGYQRLCGQNALDYVRYRHTDTDIVRAARQQDFLSNARAQVPISEVLPIIGGDTGSRLIDIFTKYTSSDIDSSSQVLSALKAFIGVKDATINEVHFDGTLGPSYVTATPEQISKAVDEFLNGKDSKGPSGGSEAVDKTGGGGGSQKGGSSEPKPPDATDGANVISTADASAATTGVNKFEAFGRTSARRLTFPVWIPTKVVPGSVYSAESRQYQIKDEEDKKHSAYKLVIQYTTPSTLPEYYGVQGTTWGDPPILRAPHTTEEIDGKDYDLYYDGDRLRLVAWHDDDGNSYWVSNTLLQTLDEPDLLAVAASTEEAHS